MKHAPPSPKQQVNDMARNGQDGWTEEHKALVRREWRAGTPTATIAAMIGRTETAVKRKAEQLGAKRPVGFTKPAPKTMAVLEDWKAGKEITAIARAHGKTRNAVYQIAVAHGVWKGSAEVRA